ncbi:MAG TPA: VWA domain-containing protein, partial [Gemmataceae bacterium]|nr:VWA domain-containing protein [Gemmataceae bacterium]
RGQHYILMIDNSASMAASDVKPSRLDWAKREALKVIDAATEDSVGMVIVFNNKATTLQAYTTNKANLREAVNSIVQTHRPTSILDALLLADSLANPLRSTEDIAVQPQEVPPGQERQFVPPKGIPTDLYVFSDCRFPALTRQMTDKFNSIRLGNTSIWGNLQPKFQLAGVREPENVNNVGIINLSAMRLLEPGARPGQESARLQVLVQLRNYGSERRQVKLRLDVRAEGELLDTHEKMLSLPPRTVVRGPDIKEEQEKDEPGAKNEPFVLKPLDLRSSTVLHAYLEGVKDDFPLDDQAWLVLGVVRKARVLRVGNDNPVLDAFFNQEATTKLVNMDPKRDRLSAAEIGTEKYRDAIRSGGYDLVIFDRCIPQTEEDMPRANTFCIDRVPPPWQRGTTTLRNPFLMVNKKGKDHPLLQHITTLWDVGVADAFRFDVKDNLREEVKEQFNLDGKQVGKRGLPPLTRLIEAGGNVPVLFTVPRGTSTDLVMTFPLVTDKGDLATSWPLQPSFPLFLRNTLLVLGNVSEGMRAGTIAPGELMVLRPEAGVQWLEITPPGGAAARLTRGPRPEFIYGNTERVGLYEVRREDDARHQFAVNLFDEQESNIEPRERFKVRDDEVKVDTDRSQPRDLWKWLVVAALLLLMIEWYVYNRRVGV